jgi:hypothetical protein
LCGTKETEAAYGGGNVAYLHGLVCLSDILTPPTTVSCFDDMIVIFLKLTNNDVGRSSAFVGARFCEAN